jgi:hypothetical protein
MFDAWIATPFKGWLSLCMPYTRQVVELIILLQVLNVISMRLIHRDDEGDTSAYFTTKMSEKFLIIFPRIFLTY